MLVLGDCRYGTVKIEPMAMSLHGGSADASTVTAFNK